MLLKIRPQPGDTPDHFNGSRRRMRQSVGRRRFEGFVRSAQLEGMIKDASAIQLDGERAHFGYRLHVHVSVG